MRSILRDLRHGFRLLSREPGLALVVALTLGLGIGVNIGVFSVVDALLLRSLPFKGGDELVWVAESSAQIPEMSVSYPNFLDWRERSQTLRNLTAHHYQLYNLSGVERPEQIRGVQASADMFALLGVHPVLGRAYTADDDRPGGSRVAVVSYSFWQSRLGGEEGALGRSVFLDEEAFEIIGVMPRGFMYPLRGHNDVQLWVPIGLRADETWISSRSNRPGIQVTGRLKPEVSLREARAELGSIAAVLAAEYPDSNEGQGITIIPLRQQVTRNLRPALTVLGVAVVLVLLISCLNTANLLLARNLAQRHEIAIRAVVGGRRGRLVAQLLAQAFAPTLIGGVFGLLLAFWLLEVLLARLDPRVLPAHAEVAIAGPELAFTLLAVAVATVLSGLLPALQATRNMAGALRAGERRLGAGRGRLRAVLVTGQVGLALLLAIVAVLFVRSYSRLTTADPGFDPHNVLAFDVFLPLSKYPEEARQNDFMDQVVEKLDALPGVVSAARAMPLLGGWSTEMTVEGLPAPDPGDRIVTDYTRVSRAYFETLGIRVLRGRPFTSEDWEGSRKVAVVDETFAETIWPDEDALGKRFMIEEPYLEREPFWMEVVGVVAHVKSYGVDKPSRIQAYIPVSQNPFSAMHVVARTVSDPLPLAQQVADVVGEVDPDQAISRVYTLEGYIADRNLTDRLVANLLAVFAGLALALAGLGVYGVTAYWVARRRFEIGVRLALGATRGRVVRLVFIQTARWAGIGMLLGLAVAFLTAPLFAHQLFSIGSRDPGTYGGVTLFLVLVACFATGWPAVKATRVHPASALRAE